MNIQKFLMTSAVYLSLAGSGILFANDAATTRQETGQSAGEQRDAETLSDARKAPQRAPSGPAFPS